MADKTGVIIYGVVAVVLVVAVHQMCNVMGLIIYGSLVFLCISIANVIMVWVVVTLILTKADSPDALGQLGTVTKNTHYRLLEYVKLPRVIFMMATSALVYGVFVAFNDHMIVISLHNQNIYIAEKARNIAWIGDMVGRVLLGFIAHLIHT